MTALTPPVRPIKGGVPGFVVDGEHGAKVRVRPLGGGMYELATSTGPHTFPALVTLNAARLREIAIHMTAMTVAEPEFPPGTPEHEAYAEDLRAELAKWAAGVQPYPYGGVR
jgi:hypothetical protein